MNSFGDLPKSVPFEKSKLHCFHGPVEGALAQPALYKRLLQGQFFLLISQNRICSFRADLDTGSAKTHATRPGGFDTFALPLPDVFPLVFGGERQNLQHQIRDECAEQIFTQGRIQQRHIDHLDVCFDFLGDAAPLFDDLFVIPAEPVDALDYQKVSFPQDMQQPAIGRSVKR